MHYDNLSAELAERLEQRSREIATEALQTANREAHAACETDPQGTWRWNFGIYIYRENALTTAPAKATDDDRDTVDEGKREHRK